jgi:hypothetical protein
VPNDKRAVQMKVSAWCEGQRKAVKKVFGEWEDWELVLFWP